MEKFIIVKVRDADMQWPPYVHRNEEGKFVIPSTNVAKIRKAIHKVSKDEHISVADMVTHSAYSFMSQEETDTIERIFNTAMSRAKAEQQRVNRFKKPKNP